MVEPLLAPRDGVPKPIETNPELDVAVARLAAGTGPVAIDAERASGYRYSQRAYLVQLRREGSGTFLIDPLPLTAAGRDLSDVDAVLETAEWVLHAASQDLPCLAELGLRPRRLFDTELAGRLAGFDRVGLGTMVAQLLGYQLEKGHSAVDWSTRPLHHEWLVYAALDVEVLVELRDALEEHLRTSGKLEWALAEFAAVAAAPPPVARAEPWRRTSGIHTVRTPTALARVRALWEARDALARQRDIAPGRVLPDAAIIAAASHNPPDERALLALSAFNGRATRRTSAVWLEALTRARTLEPDALPGAPQHDGPPPAHRWADRNPTAAELLAEARRRVVALAAEHQLPPENLLAPEAIRRLIWAPPEPATTDTVTARLAELGARDWQIALTAAVLADVLG